MDSISIDDIKSAPWNTRGEITPESVAELAASIGEQGLINPVTLWESDDGVWLCVAGNRRLVALRATGVKQLVEGSDFTRFVGSEDEAKMVTVTENLQREDVGPLEEAALVKECMDGGMSVDAIAAKTGRSSSWVRRRTKLLALDEAWKKRTDLTADVLERVAAYPADIQKKVAKTAGARPMPWKDLEYYFARESENLDLAPFDTEACKACMKRTGVEADLFGVTDGKLGRCLCCKCYKDKVTAWREEKAKEKTKGATEVHIVENSWQLPWDRGDGTVSNKKTKNLTCAVACVEDDGKVTVRWTETEAVRKERLEAEKAKNEAEREAKKAEREREDAITAKIEAFLCEDNEKQIESIIADRLAPISKTIGANEWKNIIDLILVDVVSCAYSASSWAERLVNYPWVASKAGVTAEECDYLVGKYYEEKED